MRELRGQTLALVLFIAATATSLQAQEFHFGGQIRPRLEFRDPTEGLFPSGDSESFVSMRTRAQLEVVLEKGVSAFVQIQDVRLWGEEENTVLDFNANGLDLHQGYIDIEHEASISLFGRIGRQEVNLGGQRLVGAVNWAQSARSLDAFRGALYSDAVRVDVLAIVIADATAPDNDDNASAFSAYSVLEDIGPARLDLYGFYNSRSGAFRTDQFTFGGRWHGASGRLRYRAEASYQTGTRLGSDVRAFMFGGRLGWAFAEGDGVVTAWYDYLSGGDPADEMTRVFDTLFGTNHKFYGLADYFLNIPLDTQERGLQDLALKAHYEVPAPIRFGGEFHSFFLANSTGLTTGHLGEELDLYTRYPYSSNLSIQIGFSAIFAAAAFEEIGRLDRDAFWTYLMMDVVF